MELQLRQTLFILYIIAIKDLMYVYGQGHQDMVERGRTQYNLLKERSYLPKYGSCWKAAIQNLDEGCRHLSEDRQSDIALHITNCFLEMSGHKTYSCELDVKPNLRAICINSMTDRAFNVYTEFYTHTQNICWFLRGQIWHETIAENTLKVGKQLEVTAENQESLLRAQRESLELQEKMLKHGRFLEQVLEDLYTSSQSHQEILRVFSQSISNLQTWLIGEVSWFDTIIFYSMAILLSFILTSMERTVTARLPIFLLMFVNIVLERMISSLYISSGDKSNINNLYVNIYNSVWYLRYAFILIGTFILIYKAIFHKDILTKNNELLCNIVDQNNSILSTLKVITRGYSPNKSSIFITSECMEDVLKANDEFCKNCDYQCDLCKFRPPNRCDSRDDSVSKENSLNSSKSAPKKLFPPLSLSVNGRYNLRSSSRQGTPDSTIIC